MARAPLLLALVAALALGASAALPEALENTGGPPFITALMDYYNQSAGYVVATGYIHEDTFSFTELTPEGPSTKNGKYLSWECGPANGTYTAIVEYTTTAPDGTVSAPTKVCEFGEFSNEQNFLKWAQGADGCPTDTNSEAYNVVVSAFNPDIQLPCGEAAPEESPYDDITGTTADASATGDAPPEGDFADEFAADEPLPVDDPTGPSA